MRIRSSSLGLALFAILGIFVVILLYFVGHKPFTVELAGAIAQLAWHLLVAGWVIAASAGLGSWLIEKIFNSGQGSALQQAVLQFGLGAGCLSLFVLLLGSLVGLSIWGCVAGLTLLLLLFHRRVGRWIQDMRAGIGGLLSEHSPLIGWCAGLIGALLVCTLLISLAPPLKFDALVYHLLLPQAYLGQGKVTYFDWHAMSGMPQNAEMLFTLASALGGASTAAVLAWGWGVVALLGLLDFWKEHLSLTAAWVGAASLMAGFTTAMLLGWGYVEWLVILFATSALLCLDAWLRQEKPSWLILGGVFIGFAVGTKYTSAVLGLCALAAVGVAVLRRRQSFLPAALRLGLPALAAALPWFIKNLLTTGNPVYPFLVPSGAMTSVRLSVYQSLPPWGNFLDILILPLRASLIGRESGDGYTASIGPLLVGLALFAWVGWRGHKPEQRSLFETSAVLTISGVLLWTIGNQLSGNLIQTRLYFSLFPALATLAVFGFWGLERLQVGQVRVGRILAALVLLPLAFNTLEVASSVIKTEVPQVLLGYKSTQSYLADNLGWYQPAMQAIQDLPEGKRALLLFEPRSLYCFPKCAPDEILDHWKRDRAELQDAAAIRARWLQQGFTHLLFYRTGAEFLVEANDPHHTSADLQVLKQFLDTLPKPTDFGGVYQLYSIE